MKKEYLVRYADLTVRTGINVQKGQPVLINSPIECAEFARLLVASAYSAGAGDVWVNYSDEILSRMRYDNVALELLTAIPQWQQDRYQWYLEQGAAVISIHADDPTVMEGVDTDKVQAHVNAVQKVTEDYHKAIVTNKIRWCVVSVPTAGWAKKIYPELSEEQAVEKLWRDILKSVRADLDDPVAAWKEHDRILKEKSAWLNKMDFKRLIYKNSLGTDFSVHMPKNHIWSGGSETAKDGIVFFPNMPTEEVFSVPHKDSANGRLVASHPLVYQGQLIDHFSFVFKDGIVKECHAEKGQDALESLVRSCPGSNRLGEIALVPARSPISEMGILFYNTLFDENASCHFALGSFYPDCVKGGAEMSEQAQGAAGLNNSNAHVDFMVGTEDLSITGIRADGTEVPVFINGNWAE